MKVSELEGVLLDAAVAKAMGHNISMRSPGGPVIVNDWQRAGSIVRGNPFTPSTSWAQGGPIIERERIHLASFVDGEWAAFAVGPVGILDRIGAPEIRGATPLIAAMRAYVASVLGDEVGRKGED